jgi:hypothetical protein
VYTCMKVWAGTGESWGVARGCVSEQGTGVTRAARVDGDASERTTTRGSVVDGAP